MSSNSLNQRGQVRAQGVDKLFGKTVALKDVNITVNPGEFLTLLGPSGCGKTTLLRIIAGLADPSKGLIFINGIEVNNIPPERRPSNIVFQRYALFPHLNVIENIKYGLIAKGLATDEINNKVEDVLKLVDMQEYKYRNIDQLSGGQSQRIALARSLINEPDVLLLDEPLAALDLKLRKRMQVELRQIQQKLKKTFISVTHDQGEALAISDRVAVMNEGRIEQQDTPSNIYNLPKNKFVASFVGESNFIKCKILEKKDDKYKIKILESDFITEIKTFGTNFLLDEEIEILVRPEMFQFNETHGFEGIIVHKIFAGSLIKLYLDTKFKKELLIETNETKYNLGDKVKLSFPNNSALIIKDEK